MLPYWVMFLVPALLALDERWRPPMVSTGYRPIRLDPAWLSAILLYALLIGYRVEVGGDWWTYLGHLERAAGQELNQILRGSDPGYFLFNWLSAQNDWGIYGVNLLCGLVFSIGLIVFCRSLPRPWLALAVAVPYLVIVVSMGYSRQAVALGLAMVGLVGLGRRNLIVFVACIALASTFHKSVVILVPLAAIVLTDNAKLRLVFMGLTVVVAYLLIIEPVVEQYHSSYIETVYQSSGAFIRIAMNAVPAAILLIWRRRFRVPEIERSLYSWFAVISMILLAAVIALPNTTAVDRIGLYVLPLQMWVFAHMPDVLGRYGRRNAELVALVVVYYSAVNFVWLNFADNASRWIPYRFYPLDFG